jgi:hypothetical protein
MAFDGTSVIDWLSGSHHHRFGEAHFACVTGGHHILNRRGFERDPLGKPRRFFDEVRIDRFTCEAEVVAGHHFYVLEAPQPIVVRVDRTVCCLEIVGRVQAEKGRPLIHTLIDSALQNAAVVANRRGEGIQGKKVRHGLVLERTLKS